MFDDIPLRVWLVIAIAVFAFPPAQYVYRHIIHSPSRRDITKPAEDLSWRSQGQLNRSMAFFALLVAIAVFIYTPMAEQLASSPRFMPALLAAFGIWALSITVGGFVNGRTELLAKGFYDTYDRATQPKRYWASMTWNIAVGLLLSWSAYQTNEDATAQILADRCIEAKDIRSLDQQLSACAKWIALRPKDPEPHLERGLLYLELGVLDNAAADLARAHKLDPKDPWPLANRGLVSAWKKDKLNAEADFALVRLADPTNPVMLRGEALLMKEEGDLRGAVERLTQSMKREPDNLWALRTRSELYWELGDHERSSQDDKRLVELRNKRKSGLEEARN